MNRQQQFTSNLLGTFADALSQAMDEAVHERTGLRGEASAAVAALLQSPGLTVGELARFLGMTSPSAVQAVSRLVQLGLVQRRDGVDGRTRELRLTASGRRAAGGVLAARADVTGRFVVQLSVVQRSTLESCLAGWLVTVCDSGADPDHLCRRCDEAVCFPPRCPLEYTVG